MQRFLERFFSGRSLLSLAVGGFYHLLDHKILADHALTDFIFLGITEVSEINK